MIKNINISLVFLLLLVGCKEQSNSIKLPGSGNDLDQPPVVSNIQLVTQEPIPLSNSIVNLSYDFYDPDGDEESIEDKTIDYYINGNKVGSGVDFIIPYVAQKTKMMARLVVVSKTGNERFSSVPQDIEFNIYPDGSVPTAQNIKIMSFNNAIEENAVFFTQYTFFDADSDIEYNSSLEWIDIDTNNVISTGDSIVLDASNKDLNLAFRVTPKTNPENSHGYYIGEPTQKSITDFENKIPLIVKYEIPDYDVPFEQSQYLFRSKNNYIKNYYSWNKTYEIANGSEYFTRLGTYYSFEDKNYTSENGYLISNDSVKAISPPKFKEPEEEYVSFINSKEELYNINEHEGVQDDILPIDNTVPMLSPNGATIKDKYMNSYSLSVAWKSNAILYNDNSLFKISNENNEAAFLTGFESKIPSNITSLEDNYLISTRDLFDYNYVNAKTTFNGDYEPLGLPETNDTMVSYVQMSNNIILESSSDNSDLGFTGNVVRQLPKKEFKGMREGQQFASTQTITETATTLEVGNNASYLNHWLNDVVTKASGINNIKAISAYTDNEVKVYSRILWEDHTGSYLLDGAWNAAENTLPLPFSYENSEITMSCLTSDYNSGEALGEIYALDRTDDQLYFIAMNDYDSQPTIKGIYPNVKEVAVFSTIGTSCNPLMSSSGLVDTVVYNKDDTINIHMNKGLSNNPIFLIDTNTGVINTAITPDYFPSLMPSVYNDISNSGVLIGDIEIMIDVKNDTVFAFNKTLKKLVLLEVGQQLYDYAIYINETPKTTRSSMIIIDNVEAVSRKSSDNLPEADTFFINSFGDIIPLNMNTWFYQHAFTSETFKNIYPEHYKALNEDFSEIPNTAVESILLKKSPR